MNIDHFPFANQTASVSPIWHYVTGTFSFLCLLCGILSNGLVIFVFIKNTNLRRPKNYLLINLAITDLGLLITNNTFHIIASFNTQWPFGQKGCDFYAFCGGACGLTSIATMMAISLTRLGAVINPFSSLKLTRHFTIKCITCSWLYGSIWVIPPLFGWNHFIFEGFGTTCTFDYISQNIWDRLYIIILIICGFFIPLLLIIISYIFILIKLSRRSHHLINHCYSQQIDGHFESYENNQISRNFRRTEIRAVRTALLVCGIYCIAWGPYALMTILSHFGFNYFVNAYTTAMLSLFAKTAACVNSLIYALSSSIYHRQICICVNSLLPCRQRFRSLSSNCDFNRKTLNIKINQTHSLLD